MRRGGHRRWGFSVRAVGWNPYVEEDQQAQGPPPPFQGEPRQAPEHGSLTTGP